MIQQFSVTIDNKKLRRELAKIKKKVRNSKKYLKLLSDEIEEAIEEAFASKQDIAGRQWKQWSDATIDIEGTKGSLLNRTGRLKRSIKVTTRKGSVTISARHPGAHVHQFGNRRNRLFGGKIAPIPARRYLPIKSVKNLDPNMTRRLLKVLDKYFKVK